MNWSRRLDGMLRLKAGRALEARISASQEFLWRRGLIQLRLTRQRFAGRPAFFQSARNNFPGESKDVSRPGDGGRVAYPGCLPACCTSACALGCDSSHSRSWPRRSSRSACASTKIASSACCFVVSIPMRSNRPIRSRCRSIVLRPSTRSRLASATRRKVSCLSMLRG